MLSHPCFSDLLSNCPHIDFISLGFHLHCYATGWTLHWHFAPPWLALYFLGADVSWGEVYMVPFVWSRKLPSTRQIRGILSAHTFQELMLVFQREKAKKRTGIYKIIVQIVFRCRYCWNVILKFWNKLPLYRKFTRTLQRSSGFFFPEPLENCQCDIASSLNSLGHMSYEHSYRHFPIYPSKSGS